MEPLTLVERLVELADDGLAVPDQRHFRGLVVADLLVRAAPADSGWSSGITPLPIGERTNGTCVRSMKARTSSSARDHAMPLPRITSGRWAFSSRFSAAST